MFYYKINTMSSAIRHLIDAISNNTSQSDNLVYHTGPQIQLSNSLDENVIQREQQSPRQGSSSDSVPPIVLHTKYDQDKVPATGTNNLTFKTIHKSNKQILVPVYTQSGSGDEQSDKLQETIEQHRDEYLSKAYYANSMASFLKLSKIFLEMLLIVLGIVVGTLSIYRCDPNHILSQVTAALGYLTSAIVALLSMFAPEKRAVVLKQAAIQLRVLANDLNFLNYKNMSIDNKLKILASIEERADESKISIFDMDITSFKPPEHRSIIHVPDKSESSSLKDRVKEFFKKKDRNTENNTITHEDKKEVDKKNKKEIEVEIQEHSESVDES